MRLPTDKIYLTAQKYWRTVVNKEATMRSEQLQKQIDAHRKLLSIFHVGSCYYHVFNMHSGEFDIVCPNVKQVLGCEPKDYTMAYIIDMIHPDDKSYFLNFEYKIVEFFKILPFEKVHLYKVQYDLRLRKKNGQYIRTLHQAVQIDYDRENFYRTLSIETDITHIKPYGTPCFSLIGLGGEPSYFNIQDAQYTKSFNLFTMREREVLKHIVEGKSSKQIADELFISIYTVNAHRRNIMKKADVKTPLGLVRKSIQEGWV